MKSRSLKPVGALHPILFFTGVYFVVLLFSIFICSVIFYSCNSSSSAGFVKTNEQTAPVQNQQLASTGTVVTQ
jgi:hypothetical protein